MLHICQAEVCSRVGSSAKGGEEMQVAMETLPEVLAGPSAIGREMLGIHIT